MPEMATPSANAPPSPESAPFLRANAACAFGPSFFLGHLARFVRDRCPDPAERLPTVRLYLADGATLDVCHIVGVAPRWVMLAIFDEASHHQGDMALELVAYELIQRVFIGSRRADGASIGFAQQHPPTVVSSETLLRDMFPSPPGS